ncbi:MAG: triose-phosphate isomerase [Bdellovibrionota bacterium]
MRKPMLAGNWKMNMLNHQLAEFFSVLDARVAGGLKNALEKIDILIAMPATLLSNGSDFSSKYGVEVAAQNVHWQESGAYTGEISVAMLKEVGIQATLIGHSERRQYFAETDETVAEKVTACLAQKMKVIACVGETIEEREAEHTEKIIEKQTVAILKAANADPSQLIIAYEPVWAIGTGLAATAEHAQEVHKFIRDLIERELGASTAETMRILYGGSMKPENTAELLAKPDIDGGLIGGASLKPNSFADMINFGLLNS